MKDQHHHRFPWLNTRTFSWALFDFADQAFSVLFVTLFVPILIKVHLGGTEFQIGIALSLSLLLAAVLVPFVGALSDATGRRLPFLAVSAWGTGILTVLTGYATLAGALVLAAAANVTHLVSRDVYNAKMTDLISKEYYGSLSGFGIALGYTGALATLGTAYLLLSYFGWESIAGIRASFFQAAVWYGIFSLPILIIVKDVPKQTKRLRAVLRQSCNELRETLRGLPQRPVLVRFFIASFFYGNAMSTIVIFLGLFGRESIGLSVSQFFPAFALMAVTSGIGSFFIGRLSDRFGPLFMLRIIIALWIGIILSMYTLYLFDSYALFLFLGAVGGLIFGAVWVLNRHVVAALAHNIESAKMFGISGLMQNAAGTLGPIVFGFLATVSGYPLALASMIVFFVIGLLCLPRG